LSLITFFKNGNILNIIDTKNDKTTKRQNDKTTKRQNDKTTKRQNNKIMEYQDRIQDSK